MTETVEHVAALITRAKRATQAIYLATDKAVARDVSQIILALVDAMTVLRRELDEAREDAAQLRQLQDFGRMLVEAGETCTADLKMETDEAPDGIVVTFDCVAVPIMMLLPEDLARKAAP